MSKNIMVIGEFDNDQISETTTELLSGATKLSAGGSVSIVLLGTSSDLIASQAFAAGAHKAYISSSGDYDVFFS